MSGRTSLWVLIVVFVAAGFAAAPASAQIGIGPGAYGLGFFNYSQYGNMSYYRIPYYALYPPVYYSYPVARPYGYSPFAYPPGTITPEIPPQAAAVEYRNPFVPQRKASDDMTAASAPRMYSNPYIQGNDGPLAARAEN